MFMSVYVRLCVLVCECMFVRAQVCVCVCVSVHQCTHVFDPFLQDLLKSLGHLESVFSCVYPRAEGVLPVVKAGTPPLHTAALQAWALLITLCPASHLNTLIDQ